MVILHAWPNLSFANTRRRRLSLRCAVPIPFPVPAQWTWCTRCYRVLASWTFPCGTVYSAVLCQYLSLWHSVPPQGKVPVPVPAPTVARVPGPQRLSGSSCQSAGQHYSVSHEEARNAATHCSASEPAKPAALCSVELRTSPREEAALRSWSCRAFTFKPCTTVAFTSGLLRIG